MDQLAKPRRLEVKNNLFNEFFRGIWKIEDSIKVCELVG
jgi:hypothetical protein